MIYDYLTIQSFIKEFLPWLLVVGGIVKWWFSTKIAKETTGLSRLETLSRIEERLRAGLQKQLEITESKLELANKEVERLKLLIAKYEIEVSNLRKEIEAYRSNPD